MSASASAETFFVYIVRCADDSLYVGHASDLESRVELHNQGRGALWTACRLPVRLAYSEPHPSLAAAMRRERQLKGWTYAKKSALISGDLQSLHALSRRRK